MSLQYDGAFPVAVSVGAVLLVGDEQQVVTLAVVGRGEARPFFATRSLAKFEEQLPAINMRQEMHSDLSLNHDGTDKVWRYDTKRREYLLKYQVYSDFAWPQVTQSSELNNKYTDANWIDDRTTVKAGVVPGFVVYSGKRNSNDADAWHYIRKSSIWLSNGRLIVRHTSRQGDFLDVGYGAQSGLYCSGPLHRLQRQHFQPQVPLI